jgi:hypothetical protein
MYVPAVVRLPRASRGHPSVGPSRIITCKSKLFVFCTLRTLLKSPYTSHSIGFTASSAQNAISRLFIRLRTLLKTGSPASLFESEPCALFRENRGGRGVHPSKRMPLSLVDRMSSLRGDVQGACEYTWAEEAYATRGEEKSEGRRASRWEPGRRERASPAPTQSRGEERSFTPFRMTREPGLPGRNRDAKNARAGRRGKPAATRSRDREGGLTRSGRRRKVDDSLDAQLIRGCLAA